MVPSCCKISFSSPTVDISDHCTYACHHRTEKLQISALTGGGQPEFVGDLYKHLVQQPQFSTSESRQKLVRRLREALVKCVSIVGVCKPIEAIFQIAEAERPEDRDYSFSRYVANYLRNLVYDIIYAKIHRSMKRALGIRSREPSAGRRLARSNLQAQSHRHSKYFRRPQRFW